MRTVIVRLVEPEQAGGELQGLFEQLGTPPVPFRGTEALVALFTEAARHRPEPPPEPPSAADPAETGDRP